MLVLLKYILVNPFTCVFTKAATTFAREPDTVISPENVEFCATVNAPPTAALFVHSKESGAQRASITTFPRKFVLRALSV